MRVLLLQMAEWVTALRVWHMVRHAVRHAMRATQYQGSHHVSWALWYRRHVHRSLVMRVLLLQMVEWVTALRVWHMVRHAVRHAMRATQYQGSHHVSWALWYRRHVHRSLVMRVLLLQMAEWVTALRVWHMVRHAVRHAMRATEYQGSHHVSWALWYRRHVHRSLAQLVCRFHLRLALSQVQSFFSLWYRVALRLWFLVSIGTRTMKAVSY